VPEYIISIITEYCLDFDALSLRLSVALGVDTARFILLSYPGCTKRQAEMQFYVRGDTSGAISRAVADYLNTGAEPAVVSASVKSGNGKASSGSSKTLPVTVIVIVVCAIAIAMVVLFVLVILLAVRRHRLRHQPHYSRAVGSGINGDAVLEGLYSNTGSHRANNPC